MHIFFPYYINDGWMDGGRDGWMDRRLDTQTDIQAYFIQEFLATVNVVFRQQSSVS